MRVLVVEDSMSIAHFLSKELADFGCEFRIAYNAESGLELFKSFNPEVIFSDVHMGEMSGLEMLEILRNKSQEIITVIMTAYSSEEYAIKALRLGASNYLCKPISTQTLGSLLQKYNEVVTNRTMHQEIETMVVRRSYTMMIDNYIGNVGRIVDFMVNQTPGTLSFSKRLDVRLGLVELITNAIEHGNLGISFNEKRTALDQGIDIWEIYDSYLQNPMFSQKKVTIDFRCDRDRCEWTITDEGAGFDWQAIPNPSFEENLTAQHGRGIFISKHKFDELRYENGGRTACAAMLANRGSEQNAAKQ